MFVSGVQLSNSVIHMHISILLQILSFPPSAVSKSSTATSRAHRLSCPSLSRRATERGSAKEPVMFPALLSHWSIYFLNPISPGREVVGGNNHKQYLYLF